MIEAKNLVRRYGDFVAVDNVSFSIQPGEVVGLLGHNGAGKTTIMKMLTGFLEPSDGCVLVDGLDVCAHPDEVQRQMGYLSESSPLYPELTVVDYLSYAAQLRGLKPESCVPGAVAATQLEVKAMDPIATLSRGYKQRVGVAQAILHQPKFLILDEPSNGLDPTQTQHMRDLIRNLAQHATIILSTHIMQEVKAVCDRVVILRAGQLAVDERMDTLQQTSGVSFTTKENTDVASVLSAVHEVTRVTQIDAKRWDIALSDNLETATAAVAKTLVQAGVPIYGLAPKVRDLEAIFREVSDAEGEGVTHAA